MYQKILCYCSVCHKPNDTYQQYRACTRTHFLERLVATADGRRIYRDLLQAGFVDRPDWEENPL